MKFNNDLNFCLIISVENYDAILDAIFKPFLFGFQNFLLKMIEKFLIMPESLQICAKKIHKFNMYIFVQYNEYISSASYIKAKAW